MLNNYHKNPSFSFSSLFFHFLHLDQLFLLVFWQSKGEGALFQLLNELFEVFLELLHPLDASSSEKTACQKLLGLLKNLSSEISLGLLNLLFISILKLFIEICVLSFSMGSSSTRRMAHLASENGMQKLFGNFIGEEKIFPKLVAEFQSGGLKIPYLLELNAGFESVN